MVLASTSFLWRLRFIEIPRPITAEEQPLPLDQGLRVRLELGAGVVLELSRV